MGPFDLSPLPAPAPCLHLLFTPISPRHPEPLVCERAKLRCSLFLLPKGSMLDLDILSSVIS